MRKRKIKTLFMSVLTVLCSAFVVNAGQKCEVLAAENVFEMTPGGSIRIAEPYGLRFQVKMSADVKEKADKVGMLIFPADYLVDSGEEGDVYYESVEALAATTVKGHKMDLNLTNKVYEKDGYWYGNGAIVNIKDNNMSREFVGIAYYEVDGTTIYADTSKVADTTRSAAQVALLSHTDKTATYTQETEELLLNYVDYMKASDLEKVQIKTIPHAVDNGADTAKSYWNAEYVDGGVKVTVDVIDENVSIDNSGMGYSDNIEFQMQAIDNLWHASNYSFDFLCDASGRYWARRWDDATSSYIDIALNNAPTQENDELYYLCNITEDGYQMEVFVSYDILNVTEQEAKGNVRLCPMLRNRTSKEYNQFECSDLLGCYYYVPNTWFVLNEKNLFIRPDLQEFTLGSRNQSATDIIANLAMLQAEDGGKMARTELGAHAYLSSNLGANANSGSTWCIDGIARDLLGTDYVMSSSDTASKATVTKAGWVIICVRESIDTTMIDKLESNEWKLLADKCRTALGVMGGSGPGFRLVTSYYAKECEVGEVIETTGRYAIIFGQASDDTKEPVYKTTPAYHDFEQVNDSFYMEESNVNNCCPSIAVTNGGRLYAAYMTGDDAEPEEENCGIVKYSDDDGKTWHRLFAVDTWDNKAIGTTKQTVCYDLEVCCDPNDNVLYASYALRQNYDGAQTMDSQGWMFKIENPDSEVMTEEALGVSEHWNTGIGFFRNIFTIMNDGSFMIIPNATEHSEINPVYISKDKGKTWDKVGSLYLPQSTNYDETVIVEKTDGSLWVTYRTTTGYVCESYSYDGGKTWTIGRQTNIKNPCSRFSINRLKSGKLMMVYSDQSAWRIGMMVAISEDDGKTWVNKLCLYDGFSSYPVVALDYSGEEEQIHVIFDDGRYYRNQWRTGMEDGKTYEYYAYIYHTILTEKEIMAGGDLNSEETELLLLGDSYTNPNWWLGFEGSLGTYGAETIGIEGTRVVDWNTEEKISEVVEKNPKNLFINLGINDIGAGTDGETVGNALVSYLEALKTALPNTKIYYNMMVYPSNASFSYDAIETSNNIVEAYIDGDTEDTVKKIDIRQKLMRMGETESRRFTDGLHLTAEGYAMLCDAIRKEIGIGRDVELLNPVTRLSKRLYEYAWTDWEECGIWSDAPTRYNVRGYAADEGLYINAVQYVDNIVSNGDKWNEQTHLEAQIWQHNMGQGVENGLKTDTYCAFWLDGSSWFNNYSNIGTVKNHVTITDRGDQYAQGYRYEICYEIFVPFINNTDSTDGPYAYIQFKHHMPGETGEGFEYSNQEFRDDARYLWQDDCDAYEFRSTGIVKKYDDATYMNLGTISGTGVSTWDLNVYRTKNAFYAKVSTTDAIDPSVETGVELWMHLGDSSTIRTEDTYVFRLAMKNGDVTGTVGHYPNNAREEASLSYVGRTYTNISGVTTMYIMIPFDSFIDSIKTENLGVTFRSYLGNTIVNWKYNNDCVLDYMLPIKYLRVTEENQVFLLSEEAIQENMLAGGYLKEGHEAVFDNLAVISADTGVMSTVEKDSKLLDDRTYTFDIAEVKFLEGKSYVYTGISEGAFTVKKSGYVFIIAGVESVRNAIKNDGWNTLYTNWNKMGLAESLSYFVKWCEAGESYAYGKYNIAVALDSWDETDMQAAIERKGIFSDSNPTDVFSNLGTISSTVGTVTAIENGSLLFDDRDKFSFDTEKLPFLEGKKYVKAPIALPATYKTSFVVEKAGYVFLLLPEGTNDTYASTQKAAEADGWEMVIETKGCHGSMNDILYYYVKWCEAGESYSYGRFNIAIADSTSVK